MSKTCISGKIGYPNKNAALAAAKHVHFRANHYHCAYCQQWHLSGARRKPRERRRHESLTEYARRVGKAR